MIKAIFKKLLLKSGKTYELDPAVPNSLLCRILIVRIVMLARGYWKTGRKVYIGKRCSILNNSHITFGANITIENDSIIDGYAKHVSIGDSVKIGAYSKITCTSHLSKYGKGLRIGAHSAVGDFTHFGASGGIDIGSNVIMGSNVSFHSENHKYDQLGVLIREQGVTSKGIVIGDNVWVGSKVIFLDGCHIGNNSVVAAGAVVNGQFPDNSVLGGIPAKILKTIQ